MTVGKQQPRVKAKDEPQGMIEFWLWLQIMSLINDKCCNDEVRNHAKSAMFLEPDFAKCISSSLFYRKLDLANCLISMIQCCKLDHYVGGWLGQGAN